MKEGRQRDRVRQGLGCTVQMGAMYGMQPGVCQCICRLQSRNYLGSRIVSHGTSVWPSHNTTSTTRHVPTKTNTSKQFSFSHHHVFRLPDSATPVLYPGSEQGSTSPQSVRQRGIPFLLLCTFFSTFFQLSKYPILAHLEQNTQVPKTYAVLGALLLIIVFHTINPLAAPVSNLVGWALPAYLSFKALETPSPHDDIQWLTYWAVFGFFNFLESFAIRLVLYYVPWYYAFKTVFIIWLQLPAFRVSYFSTPCLVSL